MRRRTFALATLGVAGCRRSARPRLNVFNWSDYVAKHTISNFEREFEAEVRYSVYESNEEMLAKVFSGNSGWDIVFPSNSVVQPMVENRLLAPLRHDWLPNLDNLEPSLRAPAWDRNLAWCVPYMVGATGIAYNRRLNPPPAAWADVWDPRLAGRLTMLDDPAEAIGAALKKLGLPLNSTDRGHLEQAKGELLAQKRLVRAYVNAEVRDQLVAGDVLAAQLWATTSQQAIDASPQLAFVYPREGFALYADCAVVLRETGREELSHRFINYLLRPEVAAAVVQQSKTATANHAARALLPDTIRQNSTLYPELEVLARGEWFEALPAAGQRLRDRIWTEVKSA